ncbi:hypothetical protein DQ04_02841050 [Trypanosoma grayi]|uniref:hypothetical protein n=1 Tax=Trypanosoma grayi TaxID=71804 RepID=UPI0004F457D8|nr:hypothetical protein DQ04_02841050 [Trypanosoma grayi]KEG11223.1 hypothetical protein DQ04_02841050 [Trypanosoma grayi]
MYPRVSLSTACALCKDVFRHTPHEMAKAACASMILNVTASLHTLGLVAALSDVDVALLQDMAEALRSYRCASGHDASHEEVIHCQGRCILDVLQQQQRQLVLREA